MVSLKPERLKRYKDVALLLVKYGRSDLVKQAGLDPRYEGGYIAHWLHKLLFYDLDEKFFIIGYVSFFVLVLLTLFLVKPNALRSYTRCE